MKKSFALAIAAIGLIFVLRTAAQAPVPAPPPAGGRGGARGGRGAAGGGGGGGFANAYPQRPPGDPAAVERGKSLYSSNCAFCHGPDARGGSEGGPNLIRSDLVLNDQNGDLIGPVVQNGRNAMPKLSLASAQVSDIAAFIHSFRVAGYDASRQRPESIVVGDAKAGEAYFKSKCASCHSTTGDLRGFASRIDDPRMLQQTWLLPTAGRGGRGGNTPVNPAPTTVTITLQNGQKSEGRLVRIDDFLVTLEGSDGVQRTFRRTGDSPKVDVRDPLEPHKALLRVYTDKDIHDVTAYLVTVK